MALQLLSWFTGYLLGSIPTAVWYGKLFHGVDIRDLGSKNAGATNSLRNFGKKAGIFVLIIDLLKGILAVWLARSVFQLDEPSTFITGVLAILGHLFPVFAGFKGGKGVATSLGVALAIYPLAAGVCVAVFLAVVLVSRYVSLGSLAGALAFGLTSLIKQPANVPLLLFGVFLFLLLAITHRQNIRRLLNGSESKLGQSKK